MEGGREWKKNEEGCLSREVKEEGRVGKEGEGRRGREKGKRKGEGEVLLFPRDVSTTRIQIFLVSTQLYRVPGGNIHPTIHRRSSLSVY